MTQATRKVVAWLNPGSVRSGCCVGAGGHLPFDGIVAQGLHCKRSATPVPSPTTGKASHQVAQWAENLRGWQCLLAHACDQRAFQITPASLPAPVSSTLMRWATTAQHALQLRLLPREPSLESVRQSARGAHVAQSTRLADMNLDVPAGEWVEKAKFLPPGCQLDAGGPRLIRTEVA